MEESTVADQPFQLTPTQLEVLQANIPLVSAIHNPITSETFNREYAGALAQRSVKTVIDWPELHLELVTANDPGDGHITSGTVVHHDQAEGGDTRTMLQTQAQVANFINDHTARGDLGPINGDIQRSHFDHKTVSYRADGSVISNGYGSCAVHRPNGTDVELDDSGNLHVSALVPSLNPLLPFIPGQTRREASNRVEAACSDPLAKFPYPDQGAHPDSTSQMQEAWEMEKQRRDNPEAFHP
jgi:hypothetical protein